VLPTVYTLSRQVYGFILQLYSFIHHWLYSPLLGRDLFFSFVIVFTQQSGLLRWEISPSQGRYLHTGQHKHKIYAKTGIHASSGIRTYDPSIRASEDSSCLRPQWHRHRHSSTSLSWNLSPNRFFDLHFNIFSSVYLMNPAHVIILRSD
jgi:hypothetical protein